MNRPLDAMEQMTDRFDRAASLNFTTVAEVEGALGDDLLIQALRKLETRHPLLRAAIDRSGEVPTFIEGAAAKIPLVSEESNSGAVDAAICAELSAPPWEDFGPRARLRVIRHGSNSCTVLLTLHHTVSDGSSGIIAMRDLLAAAAGQALGAALPSPGPVSFLPAPPEDAQEQVRKMLAEVAEPGAPCRLRDQEAAPDDRRPVLTRIALNRQESTSLFAAAKHAEATVQSLLCAVIAQAVASETPEPGVQRIAHPVSLRRYLKKHQTNPNEIGDAIGYYVSAVDTAHHVETDGSTSELARQIGAALARELDLSRPLLSGPIAGTGLVAMTTAMSDDEFREFTEQKVMLGSFGLSNLGRLENLGATDQIGHLTLKDIHFAVTHSIFSAFGGSASTFNGQLTLCLKGTAPIIDPKRFDRVCARVRAQLTSL